MRKQTRKKQDMAVTELLEVLITEEGEVLLANAGKRSLPLIKAIAGRQRMPGAHYCG